MLASIHSHHACTCIVLAPYCAALPCATNTSRVRISVVVGAHSITQPTMIYVALPIPLPLPQRQPSYYCFALRVALEPTNQPTNHPAHSVRSASLRSAPRASRIILIRLLEQEIGGQLLILVTGKVGLDDLVAGEAQSTQPLDGVTFFLGHGDGDVARSNRASVAHAGYAFAADVL